MYKSVHVIVWAMLVLAAITAFVVSGERGELQVVSNDRPTAGASGIARPHPPLDRAPGQPLITPL